MKLMSKSQPISLLMIIVLALLAGLGGFVVGKKMGASNGAQINSLYTTQTASIQGKITGVSDKTISITNNTGQSGSVKLADKFLINKLAGNIPTSTPSSSIKDIEVNKEATLELQLLSSGEFVVYSINYTAPLPSLPPIKLPPVPSASPAKR